MQKKQKCGLTCPKFTLIYTELWVMQEFTASLILLLSGEICKFPVATIATNHAIVRTKLTGPDNSLEGQNNVIKYSQKEHEKAVEYMEA